mmetsp:Transcript_82268/g.142952  ORF Transcript_82268/g.142952 Transcript_82268/m.142952 type:complete len:261 (-) Transcript_82268:64-846(-)
MVLTVIKVVQAGDVRRFRVELPSPSAKEGGSARDCCAAIQAAVQDGFATPDSAHGCKPLILKYQDDEGDFCTLNEATVHDLFQLCGGSTIKLFIGGPDKGCKSNSGVPDSARIKKPPADKPSSDGKASAAEAGPRVMTPRSGDMLWTSKDKRAKVMLAKVPKEGRLKPRLFIGHQAFDFKICIGADDEEPFALAERVSAEGGHMHAEVLTSCLDALCQLAPAFARTPCWHRVELPGGRSVSLRVSMEEQLHLCLKHRPAR